MPSPGFSLTREDIPRICASLVVYGACIGRGACTGIVGAAIPQLAAVTHVSSTDFGGIFSCRGAGYMAGTLASAAYLTYVHSAIPKHVLVCISILVSGVSTMLVSTTTDFGFIMLLAFGQGCGFGGVHTYATLSLLENWSQRVQPWMQIKPTAIGIGGVIGPFLVSTYGYKVAFLLAGLLCFCSLIGLGLDNLLSYRSHKFLHEGECDHSDSPCTHELTHILEVREEAEDICSLTHHSLLDEDPYVADDIKAMDQSLTNVLHRQRSGTLTNDEVVELLDIALDTSLTATTGDTVSSNTSDSVAPEGRGRTLTFATPSMQDKIELIAVSNIEIVPWLFRVSMSVFVLLHYGLFHAYSGWITSYALLDGVTTSQSDAAYLTSVYYQYMTLGSALSVPATIFLSTSTMLRFQLVCVGLGVLVLAYVDKDEYHPLSIATGMIGYGNSCIFPLVMGLAFDYGYTMDTSCTTVFIISGTIGESFIPMIVGNAMETYGPQAFTTAIISITLVMIACYIYAHYICVIDAPVQRYSHDQKSSKGYSTVSTSARDTEENSPIYTNITHQDYNSMAPNKRSSGVSLH